MEVNLLRQSKASLHGAAANQIDSYLTCSKTRAILRKVFVPIAFSRPRSVLDFSIHEGTPMNPTLACRRSPVTTDMREFLSICRPTWVLLIAIVPMSSASAACANSDGVVPDFVVCDADRDRKPDVACIVRNGLESKQTEVHILSGASGFQKFITHSSTAFNSTYADNAWEFQLTDCDRDGTPDLAGIFRRGNKGHTEIHILTGASGFQKFGWQTETLFTPLEKDKDWELHVADWDRDGIPDLAGIFRRGNKGHTEIHVLTGASGFQKFGWQTETAFPSLDKDKDWELQISDWDRDGIPDLAGIFRRGNKGHTEIHILSGASGFKKFICQSETLFPPLDKDRDWDLRLADWDGDGILDLLGIFRPGNKGHTEIHILSGASGFKTFIGHSETPLPPTNVPWNYRMVADGVLHGTPELSASVSMQSLQCLKTTGDGEDEIYIMIAGKRTSGEEYVKRVPNEHWDMTPARRHRAPDGREFQSPEKRAPSNQLLWEGKLSDGVSVELTFFVMEVDRQADPKGNPMDMAREAARATDPEDMSVIGTNHNIIGLIDDRVWKHGSGVIKDTDDLPGVVAVRLSNVGGKLEVRWVARERAKDKGGEGGVRHFELNGDNSIYKLFLHAS
jgi:hypothetical protein